MNSTRASNTTIPIPGLRPIPSVLESIRQGFAGAQRRAGRFLRLTGRRRDAFFLVGDGVVAIAATIAISRLSGPCSLSQTLALGSIAGTLVILASLAFGNYRLAWVTFSLADLRRLFGATVLVTLTLVLLTQTHLLARFSPPNPIIWGTMLFLALATFRGSKRLLVEPLYGKTQGKRTLVVMSSKHAYFLPNVLRRVKNFDYNIAGIIDPDPNKTGNYEQGIQVLGTTGDIEAIIEKYRIKTVIVMLENDPGFGLGDFYARLHRIGTVEVKTMPSLVDVLEDRSDLGALEKLCIHELTGLPPVSIDVTEMSRVFSHKRVMVTGAGGSIGSELCRQLAKFDPALLVLFERDDSNLFYIDREIRQAHPGLELVPFLGDITRTQDLDKVFRAFQPEIVFHAAAYKHVPILEFHPADAIRVNVLGTHLLAAAAVRAGTESLVYISTDKAVNPTSLMGASKRLGEMVAISMNGLCDMRVTAVRFGNVLDSRGSVSTIFREAIAKRKPITVTHRDMKRYFMLTSEAVLLVLQAASLGKGGEVFVLDMGKPVRIWDLARRMVELAGLIPNVDIPVLVDRKRPGEKLFEELLTAEEGTKATENDRIRQARISRSYCYPDLLANLKGLESTINNGSGPADTKKALTRLVKNYRPDLCTGLKPSCHLAVARS